MGCSTGHKRLPPKWFQTKSIISDSSYPADVFSAAHFSYHISDVMLLREVGV